MRFLAIDLELDPHTDTIIQIGAVIWDTNTKKMECFKDIYIKHTPDWDKSFPDRSEMTLGKLLPYGQEVLDSYGINPLLALNEFKQFMDDLSIKDVIVWGYDDFGRVLKDLHSHNLTLNKEHKYRVYDLKKEYKTTWRPNKKASGALKEVYINFTGNEGYVAHDALNDAIMTAGLKQEFINRAKLVEDMKKLIKG
jgi:hypothetical protein